VTFIQLDKGIDEAARRRLEGEAELLLGDEHAAQKTLLQATALEPDNAQALRLLGESLLRQVR